MELCGLLLTVLGKSRHAHANLTCDASMADHMVDMAGQPTACTLKKSLAMQDVHAWWTSMPGCPVWHCSSCVHMSDNTCTGKLPHATRAHLEAFCDYGWVSEAHLEEQQAEVWVLPRSCPERLLWYPPQSDRPSHSHKVFTGLLTQQELPQPHNRSRTWQEAV